MLTQATTTVMIPVSDVDRASEFYADKLGLRRTGAGPDGSPLFEVGNGDGLGLLPSQEPRSGRTLMSFKVDDLASEIRELEGRGVMFEDYDLPGLRTVDHIADTGGGERAAWFTDSEGNILCVHEQH